jgi:hypothetical protein
MLSLHNPTPPQPPPPPSHTTQGKLIYDAIALDMDGTLTQAHIDFVDMRKRTGAGRLGRLGQGESGWGIIISKTFLS